MWPWGDEWDANKVNSVESGPHDTTAVGSYRDGSSPYGAYDMAGNVGEWVADWYDSDYYGQSPSSNPQGPDAGIVRVLRGGSMYYDQNIARAANRNYAALPRFDIGFRCVASPRSP